MKHSPFYNSVFYEMLSLLGKTVGLNETFSILNKIVASIFMKHMTICLLYLTPSSLLDFMHHTLFKNQWLVYI